MHHQPFQLFELNTAATEILTNFDMIHKKEEFFSDALYSTRCSPVHKKLEFFSDALLVLDVLQNSPPSQKKDLNYSTSILFQLNARVEVTLEWSPWK